MASAEMVAVAGAVKRASAQAAVEKAEAAYQEAEDYLKQCRARTAEAKRRRNALAVPGEESPALLEARDELKAAQERQEEAEAIKDRRERRRKKARADLEALPDIDPIATMIQPKVASAVEHAERLEQLKGEMRDEVDGLRDDMAKLVPFVGVLPGLPGVRQLRGDPWLVPLLINRLSHVDPQRFHVHPGYRKLTLPEMVNKLFARIPRT